jgi:tagatose 6-phosphate kinase
VIVCLGTTPALARTMQFDGLTIDGVNRAADVYEYASGKSINAARVMSRLGQPTMAILPVGCSTGSRLQELIQTVERLRPRCVEVQTPTRLCVTVIDRLQQTTTELIENGGPLRATEVRQILSAFEAAMGSAGGSAKMALLTGSLAAGVSEKFYADCVTRCVRAGVRVVLDAVGTPLLAAIDARPTVIKLNADELGKSVNRSTASAAEVHDAAADVARQTGGWVIVTRGRSTTIAVHAKGEALRVSVPAVKVISAIGSGDSFAAGLAVALAGGSTMSDALMKATACASANAMTPHAGHVELKDVRQLASQVRVEPLIASE